MKTISEVWPEWNIEKEIGRGSYGTVYKCSKEINGVKEYSAIKVIAVPQSEYEMTELISEKMTNEQSKKYYKDIADDLVKEIEILKTLKGTKNIVEIYDAEVVEKDDGIGWYILIRMELLTDFNTYSSDKKFTEAEVIKLGLDISSALSVCHKAKIIHRDIKPENIFVDAEGNFRLGDFGVAKRMEKTQGSMSIKGTYNYMPPEVFSGKKSDGRADMYSLALVMYKLLNNDRLPFLDPDKQLIRYNERQLAFEKRIKGEQIPDIKGVSKDLNDIILKACAFKSTDRQRNINEFKKQLEKVAKGKKVFSGKKNISILFGVLLCVLAMMIVVFGDKNVVNKIQNNNNIIENEKEETKREYNIVNGSWYSMHDSKEAYRKYLYGEYSIDLDTSTKINIYELIGESQETAYISIYDDKYIYYNREKESSDQYSDLVEYELYRYDTENKNKELLCSGEFMECLYFDDNNLYFIELEETIYDWDELKTLKRLNLKDKKISTIGYRTNQVLEYNGYIIYVQDCTITYFDISPIWCYDTATGKNQMITERGFPIDTDLYVEGDNLYFKEYVSKDSTNEASYTTNTENICVSKYNLKSGNKNVVNYLNKSRIDFLDYQEMFGWAFNDKFAILPSSVNIEDYCIRSYEDESLNSINWPKKVEIYDGVYVDSTFFTDKTITENLLYIEYEDDGARLCEILPNGEVLQCGNELFVDNLSENTVRIGSKLVDLNTSGENIIIYDFFEGESTKR